MTARGALRAALPPGHVNTVIWVSAFRASVEAVRQDSTLAFASQVTGSACVYATPVVRLLQIVYCRGHDQRGTDERRAYRDGVRRLVPAALALLISGCGLLKGNISAQVGALYPEGDAAGRTRGFSIFSMGINVGATAGPLVCGALAQFYGGHAGFGLAGILMLLGLFTYIVGYRGSKRYSRDRFNFSGTHSTSTSVALLGLTSRLRSQPANSYT